VKLRDSWHAKERLELEPLIGPEAARLAVLGWVGLRATPIAAGVCFVLGIWLERRGPAVLWPPMIAATIALLGLFVTGAITDRRMNRAASQHVSQVLGYQVIVFPSRRVLRRSAWESAIERAKRVHEREAAGKPQRWHL